MNRIIHGERIFGVEVDAQTRCAHYHSPIDVIAIKFRCCEKWFPCFECHAESVDHTPQVWEAERRDQIAILCGSCGEKLSINEYFASDSTCPACEAKFNPGCANHYHLYFET